MAYTRLLRLYYRRELPLPTDVAQVCRLVRATGKPEREAVQTMLSEFFTLESDGWHNKRCDQEIGIAQDKAYKNRMVGKLGGRPKKNETTTVPENNHDGFEMKPTDNPSQTPDTRHQTPDTIPSPEAQDDDRLARWMFGLINQAVPGTKQPKFDKWQNTIRLMRERDSLTHRQIAEVFAWANRDAFWQTNILSPDKLREKFPQLQAKSQETPHGKRDQHTRQTATDRINAALGEAFGDTGTGIVLEADFDRIDAHEITDCRSGSVPSVV
jgi:uncharacterized protein YdaU (DUF1376 family)